MTRHKVLATLFELNVCGHLFAAQLVLAPHDGGLGLHLRFLNLALLLFHRDFRIELVLTNGPLVLHRGHAAQVDRVIRCLEVGLPGGGLQRPCDIGHRLDRHNGNPQNFQTQGGNFGLCAQLLLRRTGNGRRCLERSL